MMTARTAENFAVLWRLKALQPQPRHLLNIPKKSKINEKQIFIIGAKGVSVRWITAEKNCVLAMFW